jgi:ferric-dicitrate binding protein FerR (iron transport regulator)
VEELKSKIISGAANAEERLKFYQWLEANPQEKKEFIDIKNLFAAQKATTLKREPEQKRKHFESIWSQVGQKNAFTLWKKVMQYAAFFILFLAVGLLYYNKQTDTETTSTGIVSIVTEKMSTNSFKLADGSTIWMNANSQIDILSQQADEVILKINGQAVFDIRHNEDRTFIVNASDLQIVDRGTKFSVQVMRDSIVKTSLLEGKIEVLLANNERHSLTPGQRFIYSGNGFKVESFNPTSSLSSIMSDEFVYRNTKLTDIANEIEQWYGVQVNFQEEETMNYKFSGTFSKNISIEKFMHMLCYTSNINYKIIEKPNNETIVIIK